MSLQVNISGLVNNDLSFECQAFYQGAFLPLTGYTVSAVVKASRSATDGSGTSYTQGGGITITNSALGEFTLDIPHTSNETAGTFWYRIDLTNGSEDVTTCLFGVLTINAA